MSHILVCLVHWNVNVKEMLSFILFEAFAIRVSKSIRTELNLVRDYALTYVFAVYSAGLFDERKYSEFKK